MECTATQLRQNWMVIGTENKKNERQSAFKKRIMVGEKGLGCLGLDRLCDRTIIQTFTTKHPNGIELEIDWTKYEHGGFRLERIKHNYYKIPKLVSPLLRNDKTKAQGTHGTRLILENLKDEWSPDALKELKQELSLLISPFSGINDFNIELNSGMLLKEIDGKINASQIIKGAEWKIDAQISKKNEVTYSFSSDVHNKTFSVDPVAWKFFLHGMGETPQCGPVKFLFLLLSSKRNIFR